MRTALSFVLFLAAITVIAGMADVRLGLMRATRGRRPPRLPTRPPVTLRSLQTVL